MTHGYEVAGIRHGRALDGTLELSFAPILGLKECTHEGAGPFSKSDLNEKGEPGVALSMETATRLLGTCPVCEGTFKTREGRMVHHGYERPGDGMIHGDCFAVNRLAYELSCDATKEFLVRV